MQNYDTKTKAIMAIAQAYEQKNTQITNRIESIVLPNEITLPKELNELLESYGKNPIEEPEYYKQIQELPLNELRHKSVKDKNIDDFDALDISEFMTELNKRITNKIDEDGKYKTTPALDGMKLPKTTQIETLIKVAQDKKPKAVTKEIYKIAELVQDDLTDWEQQLVESLFLEYTQAVNNALTIKASVDRTPFARYLKN